MKEYSVSQHAFKPAPHHPSCVIVGRIRRVRELPGATHNVFGPQVWYDHGDGCRDRGWRGPPLRPWTVAAGQGSARRSRRIAGAALQRRPYNNYSISVTQPAGVEHTGRGWRGERDSDHSPINRIDGNGCRAGA